MALLPVGLISVMQTQSVAEQGSRNAEMALLALTEKAAVEERLLLARGRGAAELLSNILPDMVGDPEACTAYLTRFVANADEVTLAAYLPPSGILACASSGHGYDFSQTDYFEDAFADPRIRVDVNSKGPISGKPVLILSRPVYDADDAMLGIISLSIPHDGVAERALMELPGLIGIITFNGEGRVLTASDGLDEGLGVLPDPEGLSAFIRDEGDALRETGADGIDRIYTVAPIVSESLFVLGIWDNSSLSGSLARNLLGSSLFPALMWGTSLIVAFLAVHRLMLQHLRRLARQMARFAKRRRIPEAPSQRDTPTEFLEIHDTFERMTVSILQDEAALENAVHEKNVLVKEIHHRVKNNLQLISSIINMHIREADAPEAKAALRQMQDRVRSMATIHSDLYQTGSSGRVNAGHLLREVLGDYAATADPATVRIDGQIDDLWLYPDQAVPLSLLAAESVARALEGVVPNGAGPAGILVRLGNDRDRDDGPEALFEVSVSDHATKRPNVRKLSDRLIEAFAVQLGAKLSQERGETGLRLTFAAQEFSPGPGTF